MHITSDDDVKLSSSSEIRFRYIVTAVFRKYAPRITIRGAHSQADNTKAQRLYRIGIRVDLVDPSVAQAGNNARRRNYLQHQ